MGKPFLSLSVQDIMEHLQNFYRSFQDILKARADLGDQKDALGDILVVKAYLGHISELKAIGTFLMELGNAALKPRHWQTIFSIISLTYLPDFTLKDLLDSDILNFRETITLISRNASGIGAISGIML